MESLTVANANEEFVTVLGQRLAKGRTLAKQMAGDGDIPARS
jgi:ABC-type uncharacterized transport system ATPase component